jgi:hypothetical protein
MNTDRPRDAYSHEDLEELAAGWALYALEPDTEAIFAEHLPQCGSCQRAVDSYQATLGELALLTPQVDPPESLGQRISAAVRAEMDGPPATGRASVSTDRTDAPSPAQRQAGDRRPTPGPGGRPEYGESRGPGRGQDAGRGPGGREGRGPGRMSSGGGPGLGPGRRTRRSRLAMAAAGAALAIVVGLGAWNVVLLGQVDDAEQRADRTSQQAESAAERSQRTVDILRQMAEPGARVTALSDQGGRPQGYVLVNADNVDVVADGLPRNDAQSSIYVLWAVNGKAPRPVGSFDVKQGEFEQVRIGSLPSGGLTEFAVSKEPGRQTPAKPTVVVASGKVER